MTFWIEIKCGLGLSINYIRPQMGYEPFIKELKAQEVIDNIKDEFDLN